MAIINIALFVAGSLIIAIVLVDAFFTILSADSAGPLTKGWSRPLWRLSLAIHSKHNIHGLLRMSGPLFLLATILIWYFGLVVGNTLVFASADKTVKNSSTNMPAELLDIIYFVPSTLSGLGYGDYVPSGPPWTTFATLSSLAGTMVITTSLSYVISVLGAAVTRRSLASSIYGLGDSPVTAVRTLTEEPNATAMHSHAASLASTLGEVAQQQLAYPVLRYFHSAEQKTAIAPAALLFADTEFLARGTGGESRVSPGLARVCRNALDGFAANKSGAGDPDDIDPDRARLEQYARELGLETGPGSAFDESWDDYSCLRQRLLTVCVDDGWGDEVGAQTVK